ncbi:MAG: NAD-dependent epimerase/dehydratase family protein [Rhodocyclaceae bacterium]|nr:NAD-dependent epimerase/dehydratase family protein [Rhodocyclaceae bacterium]
MHVLVTGGAGFIGSHSVDALLGAGARVRVLDNFSTGKRENLPAAAPQLEIVAGDIRDVATVERCVAGVSHVLHLAAQVSVAASVSQPLNSASVNVTGFLNVLEASRKAGAKRLVYASSAAVYGDPTRLPIDESAPTAPLSPYGLEKLVNDQYAELYRDLYGQSNCGLRYFNVYGPRQDPHSPYSGVISVFAQRLRAGAPITINGDGRQTRDFIFVGDVARANLAALQCDTPGVVNIATGRSVTLLDLVGALATTTATPPQVQHGPPREGDIRYSAADNSRLVSDLRCAEFVPLEHGLYALMADSGNR